MDRYPFMLLSICNVSQTPTGESILPTDQVRVNATITHLYTVERVTLNYTVANDTGTFTVSVNMTTTEDNIWNATIPPFPLGTNITYTIIAQDSEGNIINSQQQGYTCQYQVIPEFSPTLALPIFMIATLLSVIIYKRKTKLFLR